MKGIDKLTSTLISNREYEILIYMKQIFFIFHSLQTKFQPNSRK